MAKANTARPGFPPKGSLKKTPFSRIMRQLANARATGALYLLSGETKKVVFIENGAPVYVRSNVLSECLGQVLAREGLITRRQCDESLDTVRRTGKKQGELLVEMGVISDGNLRYGLESQLRVKLFDVFGWDNGRYQFKPAATGPDLGIRLRSTAASFILSAVLETFTEEKARGALEPVRALYPLKRPREPKDLEITPAERHFLQCLDGSRSVDELLDTSEEPPLAAPAALLQGLIQAGLCQLAKTKRSARTRPPKPRDQSTRPDSEFIGDVEVYTELGDRENTPLPTSVARVASESGRSRLSKDVAEQLRETDPEGVDPTFDEEIFTLAAEELEFIEEEDGQSSSKPPARTPPSSEAAGKSKDSDADEESESESEDPADSPDNESGPTTDSAKRKLGEDEPDVKGASQSSSKLSGSSAKNSDKPARGQSRSRGRRSTEDRPSKKLNGKGAGKRSSNSSASESMPLLSSTPSEDLLDVSEMDDLDDITLELADDADPTITEGIDDPEILLPPSPEARKDYQTGQEAMAKQDWASGIDYLERAESKGYDSAELHAMLAYARFQAGDQKREVAEHALELLEYAEDIDPDLDLVYAYRASVLVSVGNRPEAATAVKRALELNPDCKIALDVQRGLDS